MSPIETPNSERPENSCITPPPASDAFHTEAMEEARRIQTDVKSGNVRALERDAQDINNHAGNNQESFQDTVQSDLAAIGLPNVSITQAQQFTEITVASQAGNGNEKLTSYWAGEGQVGTGSDTISSAQEHIEPIKLSNLNSKLSDDIEHR